jgi:hypothetical protein
MGNNLERIVKKALWSVLLLALWVTASTIAQECPDYVTETLAEVADTCSGLARNEACYGNTDLVVETNADVIFENPGDIINVGDIESISISGAQTGDWGVAVLNLQADLPYTIPGQNVTVLLFGNVELTPVDDALRAFYFTGGIGQPSCSEAPDGMVLQSPEGQTSSLTINGARVEFGSTIFLQLGEEAMSVTTLAGIATLQTEDGRQIVPQGTQSHIELDDNEADSAPTGAAPLDAAALLPYIEAVNNSGLMLTTYEDAALNPRIQSLVEEGLMPALSAENPLISLDEDAIPAVIEALEDDIIPIGSGYWRLASQTHELTGDCIDSSNEGNNGGGVGDGEEYTTPICGLEDNAGIAFGSNPIYALGLNVYGEEYTSEQPNFGGEGTVIVTNRWEYRIISPTQIEMTFTSVEEGGCTLTSVFIYELVEEDEDACEDSNDYSSPSDDDSSDFTTAEVSSGTYSSSDLYVMECDADIEEAMETLTLEVDKDSLSVSLGEETFELPEMNGIYMFYEGQVTFMVMSIEEGTLSISYMNGTCMAAGNYTAAD